MILLDVFYFVIYVILRIIPSKCMEYIEKIIEYVEDIVLEFVNRLIKFYKDRTFAHENVKKEFDNQESQTEIVCSKAMNMFNPNTLWLYNNIPMFTKHEILSQICEEELNSDLNCFFHPEKSFFTQKENSFVDTCSLCRNVSHSAQKCPVYKGIKSDIPCHICYERGNIAYHNSFSCRGISYHYLKNKEKDQMILEKLAMAKNKYIKLHRYHLGGLRDRHNEEN